VKVTLKLLNTVYCKKKSAKNGRFRYFIHTYIHICMYVCVCVYIYIYIYIYIYTRLIKQRFVVTHIIRQTVIPALLDSWDKNTPSVKILYQKNNNNNPSPYYFRNSKTCLDAGKFSSDPCKTAYGWVKTDCSFMGDIVLFRLAYLCPQCFRST
jgi:hypothetical protein